MPKHDHPPAFPFYVDDFIADSAVDSMSNEELGMYTRLLCKAWKESPVGTIPDDDRILTNWAKASPREWKRCKSSVLRAFVSGDDGRYHQKRMKVEWQKLITKREERSKSGSWGAEKRWQSHSKGNGTDIANSITKNSIPSSISPSSSNILPPPSVTSIDSKTLRELEEEVSGCGVEDARRAVRTAIEAGCTAADIRAVILAWCKRNGDLGPGSLHYRLMDLKPGDEPERGWPKPEPVVAAKKHAAKVQDRERAEEEANSAKVRSSDAAAADRERRYGQELDSMDPNEISEICKSNPPMAKLFRKGEKSPLLRSWLLRQIELRSVQQQ